MQAVIFDMDGVISDTQKLHSTVEAAILREYGITLDPADIARRFAGVPDHVFFEQVAAEAGTPLPDIPAIIARKYDRMLKPQQGDIVPIPGTLEFISKLHAQGTPLAVASGSSMAFIDLVLSTLDAKKYFQALVSTDEVTNGKPAPDIFLLAAKRLGVEPAACTVIEDGIHGMRAANAAGMRCIALLTQLSASECPVETCVHSLLEINPATLQPAAR